MSSLILAAGLLASALLALFIWSLTNSRARAIALANDMTHDLQDAQAELRAKHAELKAGAHRLRTILETQPDCVKQVAADGTLLAMNRAGLCLVEAERLDQVVGRFVFDFVAPEHQAMFRALNEAIFRGESRTAEFEIIGLKGTRRWMQTHACPLRDIEGGIVAHLAVASDITARKRSEAELEKAHGKLVDLSREAGMAEVATSVLHNVGNVLNSVNVSATIVSDKIQKSERASLAKVVALLRENEANLGAFLSTDAKGKQIVGFLEKLVKHLSAEQAATVEELNVLRKNIDHIKDVVAMQQSYAKVSGVNETLSIVSLIEDTLHMNAESLARHDVEVVREFADVPDVTVDKHKLLQILVNLVRNAKHSCDDAGRTEKRLTLRVANGNGRVKISVSDNGLGIPPENLARIFNHGFTTKKEGHGFGLHSGALAAREMGGALTVHSEGMGHGATFTVELPLQPLNKSEN